MKKIILTILLLFFSQSAFAYYEGALKTKDNVKIAFNEYNRGFDDVLVIAPGWFMTKDSAAFKKMSEDFSRYFNVITFDFRGHQKSGGFYTFGSKETSDLEAVIKYANKKYKKVYLMGFSLGSLIAIDYCAKNFDVDKLILVSAPTDFNLIENNFLSKNAVIPTCKKFEFERWFSIRFALPTLKKPRPIDLIDKIIVPVFLIAGENDPIINSWHNFSLFQKTKSEKKQIVIKNANHAEDIYLDYPIYFLSICKDFLQKDFTK